MKRHVMPLRALSIAIIAIYAASALAQETTSPREQLQQYETQLQANPSDDVLRTKIIQLAQQLQPPPAIPPEADELAGRAQYIFEHATSPDDLLKAADAFEKVTLVVPWLPDYYFDAAVAYEKANHPADALRNYKLSNLAYPQESPDAKKVREKIGALSYVLEQQQAAAQAEQAQKDAEAKAEQERRDAEAQAERQRELDAKRAREQAQREEQQRLANLDPLVRSLDGAVYSHERADSLGNRFIVTWTITGDRISEEYEAYSGHYDGGNRLIDHQTFDYPIDGRAFRVPLPNCARDYGDIPRNAYCYAMGTISEKEISWTGYVNGTVYATETRDGYWVLGMSVAKRTKSRGR
ncbi:MAG TPA: hypothetical protein VGR47_16220 [Terracidiphilus sp.]|nr:hypothetical protein [Terracidiphilus sp.]